MDQKNNVLKQSKKSGFYKGVSPCFLSKNRTFYHVCFFGKPIQKSLTYGNLSKRLVHGLDRKIEHFMMYVSWGKLDEKRSFFDTLNKQECFLDQKNGVSGKSKRSRFCKGVSPCFLSKNRTFDHVCFFGKSI